MAYDEDLADRIRALLGSEPAQHEQRMFGGLAFLINGHMAIAVSSQGGILVRVDPADADGLIGSTNAHVVIMGERRMRGWLRVAPEHVGTDRELAPWVSRGAGYARSLPAKGQRRRR